ncbi:MAK10-like protein [Tanacetum coccineum]
MTSLCSNNIKESLSEAWTPTKRAIDQSDGGKLSDRIVEESWALLEDLTLYDNESWNDPRDFTKSVKAISLPQDVPSTSDSRLIELENQVHGPQDTQYCMENPEEAFVDYASSLTDEAGGALSSDTVKNLKLNVNSTSPVLSARSYLISQLQTGMGIGTQQTEEPEQTLEDKFKDLHLNLLVLKVLTHALMYNAILDKYLESLEVGKNRLGDSEPFDTLANLGACVNIIPLYLFKKLNIRLLEETNHVFGLVDGTKSYPIGIVRDVKVHIGRLKLLTDFYVIDIKNDPETPLLVGRGFLATANVVIDCRKAKIAVGEGITRSVFGVKGIELG